MYACAVLEQVMSARSHSFTMKLTSQYKAMPGNVTITFTKLLVMTGSQLSFTSNVFLHCRVVYTCISDISIRAKHKYKGET